MPTFDSQVKFQKIPVSQLVVEQAAAASAPASPIVGQLWFDTTNNQLKVCTNATGPVWTQCDNVTGGTASNVTDGDKGEITVASGIWTIDNGVVTLAKLAADSVDSSKIVAGSVAYSDLNADTKDQAAGTSSMRTLGTSGTSAAAGNDSRLSDARTPSGTIGGDMAGSTWPTLNLAAGAVDLAGSEVANTLPHGKGGTGYGGSYSGAGCVIYQNTATGFGGTAVGSTGQVLQSNSASAPSWVNPTALQGLRLDTIAAPTSQVSLNGQKLTLVSDPTNPTDGANKLYVDSVAQGLDAKASVRMSSQAGTNYSLSGQGGTYNPPDGFGGMMPVTGDRVLVSAQTNPAENGIYVVAAGAWSRATDMDNWSEVPGAFVFVEEGINENTGWTCMSDRGGTIGSTAMVWTQFSGAGSFVDGTGLLRTGNTLDVRLDNNSIEAPSDILTVKPLGITTAKLADTGVTMAKLNADTKDQAAGVSSLRSLGTGTTQAAQGSHGHSLIGPEITGILGPGKGGTGADATTLSGQLLARSNLGAQGLYATLSPALTAGTWATITHNMGARARNVSFEEMSTGEGRVLDWRVNQTNPGTQVDIRCDIVGGRSASYYQVNVAC